MGTNITTKKVEEMKKEKIRDPRFRQFYISEDLEEHTLLEDCWISIHHKVLDISSLLIRNKNSRLIQPLLLSAGSDISHWFDKKTGNPITRIDADIGKRVPFLPEGRYLHIPSPVPIAENEEVPATPWWRDSRYVIGHLTQKTRPIRIINTLTH